MTMTPTRTATTQLHKSAADNAQIIEIITTRCQRDGLDMPKLLVHKCSGNRRQLTIKYAANIEIILFSLHRDQHQMFHATVAHLRTVLAALVTPAPTVPACTYSDYDSDWPAAPFVASLPQSQHATPAAAVGVEPQMSALASKSQTKQDKFAAVTERIMNDKKPASKGNFNPVKPKPTMPEINSVYRNNCKADTAMLANEAGI